MSAIIQQKYIALISSTLDRFKWVVPTRVANFRCNICGDSERSDYKSRGYFYIVEKSDCYNYKCQNCGASMSFKRYIYLYYPHYSKELRLEEFTYKRGSAPKPIKKKRDYAVATKVEIKKTDTLLVPIKKLDNDHPAYQYILSRRIPKSKHSEIFFTSNFKEWVEQYQEVGNRKYPEDERIVFLMKDEEGNIYGAQGRSIDTKSKLRYITVKFDDNKPKLFGLNKINKNYPIIVTEGVIDSFFLPNSLAICGGDIGSSLTSLNVPMNRFIILLDNERRSADTINRMEKAIDAGCNIVITELDSRYKDINAMILNGISIKKILSDIKKNTYRGIRARAKLNHWKRY